MTECKECPVARQIYLTSQAMRNFAEKVLRPYDLTIEQLHLLKNMPGDSSLTQREFCDVANKTPANMTRMLDRLEIKGLVTRRDNPKDRRASLLNLTPQGQSVVSDVHSVFEAFSSQLLEGISEKDQKTMRKSLEKMIQNVEIMTENNEKILKAER